MRRVLDTKSIQFNLVDCRIKSIWKMSQLQKYQKARIIFKKSIDSF